MRILNLEEYSELELPGQDLKWVVKDLIPKPGLITILGEPKSGKSFFALQVCLNLAQGLPVFGVPTEPHRTLYLQFDTSNTVWKERIVGLRDRGIDISGQIMMVHPDDLPKPCNLERQVTRDTLKKALDTCQPDIVVIDVLRELHQKNENDSTDMKIIGDHMMSLFQNQTILLVHHSKKIWQTEGVEAINPISYCRGSSYIPGKSDAIWLIHKEKIYLVPRFARKQVLDITQTQTGLFDLTASLAESNSQVPPTLDNAAKRDVLIQLCVEHPNLRKHQIFAREAEHLESLGIGRSLFYRLLANHEQTVDVVPVP